jgi:hypothetical protein
MKQTPHDLRLRLAASTVDSKTGIISGATVAKAGVPAIGKFIYEMADGALSVNPEGARRKLSIATDAKTLSTLMAAIEAAGGKLKVRVDHNDEIGARVGYATTFRQEADRVICDIQVYDSSPHRALVLETATRDAANVGLSIDFNPTFEVIDGVAFMRAESIRAVDVVDAGAITPDGLFLSASVDTLEKGNAATTPKKINSPDTMPEDTKKEPTMGEIMAALSSLTQCVAKLTEKPATAPTEAPVTETLSATVKTMVTAELGAMKAELGKFQAALGIKPEGVTLAAGADAGTTTQAEKPKAFLELVDAEVAASNGKLARSDAHRSVMRKDPSAYRRYLADKGVFRAA